MTCFPVTLAVGLLAAAPALGQGFSNPLPTPPPIRVPGTPGLFPTTTLYAPRFGPAIGTGFTPGLSGRPWAVTGWGAGAYIPSYYPYYAPTYMTLPSPAVAAAPAVPALQGAGVPGSAPAVPLNPEFVAELTVEFPAAAEVTVNGSAAAGEGATRTMTSPPLKVGQTHTFTVAANWTAGGQRYTWEKTVTLGPGERSRVAVARGFPVKN